MDGMNVKRRNVLVKIAVAAAVLAGLGLLFVRSARTARAAPYTLTRPQLRDWSLALESASSPTAPLLVLRPPQELAPDLFHQIFARAMETLNAPEIAGMPLLLQNEFDAAFAGRVTPAALLDAARTTGLESACTRAAVPRLAPRERAGDHASGVFRAVRPSGIRALCTQLAEMARTAGAPFDPGALSSILMIAGSGQPFSGWLPLHADPKADCVAPIVMQ